MTSRRIPRLQSLAMQKLFAIIREDENLLVINKPAGAGLPSNKRG